MAYAHEAFDFPWAYALPFPKAVTDNIAAFRDWHLEEVKRNGGTPVARMWKQLGDMDIDPSHPYFQCEADGRIIEHVYGSWLSPYESLAAYECDSP